MAADLTAALREYVYAAHASADRTRPLRWTMDVWWLNEVRKLDPPPPWFAPRPLSAPEKLLDIPIMVCDDNGHYGAPWLEQVPGP